MILRELICKHGAASIVDEIFRIYYKDCNFLEIYAIEAEDLKGYFLEGIDNILGMEEEPSEYTALTVRRGDPLRDDLYTVALKGPEYKLFQEMVNDYAVDFVDWSEIIDLPVEIDKGVDEKVAVAVIVYELTFYGNSMKEINAEADILEEKYNVKIRKRG